MESCASNGKKSIIKESGQIYHTLRLGTVNNRTMNQTDFGFINGTPSKKYTITHGIPPLRFNITIIKKKNGVVTDLAVQ